MDLSSQPSQEGQTQYHIIIKLKKHFEDSVDLQKFSYYVRPLAETNMNSQGSLCLLTEVNKFVAVEHQCSLLILGDSGNGKSLLGQYVVWQLWKEYQPDKIIPIFIHLPLIPQGSRAQKLLKSYLKSAGLNEDERTQLVENNKLLLVLDGYDEIPEIGNLYKQNHWGKHTIKMMTTCRPEALLQRQTGNSYQELFLPKGTETYTSQDRFVEFHLKKFNLDQIDKYLEQYVAHCEDHYLEDWKTYKQNLDAIPGVLELVATPFILSIVVRVLPRMIKKYQSQELHEQRKLVRAEIYDYFVDDWFDFQVERFREQGKLHSLKGDLKQYLKIYSQNLAYKALSQGRLEIAIDEHETLNPELLRPKDHNLFPQYTLDLPRFTDEAMRYIRSGCLLKTGQSYFSFLHKSLIEYFAAQDLFTGVHLSAELYTQQVLQIENLNKSLSLNDNLLMTEPAIIKILADRVQTDTLFKQLLYDVMEFSKRQPLIEIAAANAITILNAAGESFSCKDFRQIRIPKANLSGAVCDQTDFSGADLRGVCFHHAWLKGSNFSKAQMLDIDFAELPGIENSHGITSFCIAPDETFLLIGDMNGKLSKWDLASGEMEWKESVSSNWIEDIIFSFFNEPIRELAISPDGKIVAINASDGIVHLWDLVKRKEISSLFAEEIIISDDHDILNIQFCPPDGKRLIFSEKKIGVQVWDVESHKCLRIILRPFGSIIALSSNEKFFVFCESNSDSDSSLFFFYDTTTLSLQSTQEINLKYEYGCFSPSAKYFGAVVGKSQIQLLNLTYRRNTKTFERKGGEFRRVFFSPDEYLIIAMSDDKFYFWHIDSGMYLYDLAFPFNFYFPDSPSLSQKPLFSPINSRHLFHLTGNKISAWYIQTTPSPLTKSISQFQTCYFQEKKKYFQKKNTKPKIPSSLPSNCVSVLLGAEQWKVEVYFPNRSNGYLEVTRAQRTKRFNLKLIKEHCNSFLIFSLSRNHRYLAVAIAQENNYLSEIAFPILTEGKKLLGRLLDTDIRVLDLEKDQQIYTFRHSHQISYLRFSDDNEWLVTGGNTVRIWNLSSGKYLHKFCEHKGGTDAIALTSDKRFLAIADGARSVSIWDISTQKSVFLISQLPFKIYEMLFIKNDKYLLCQTKQKEQILFRFHHDGKKATLNLIKSSKNFDFNPFEANFRGAYGLSNENQRLLQQKGAIGTPSECSVQPQSKNSFLQIIKLNSVPQPAVKITIYSFANSKIAILYENWVISLMRKPSGKEPEHVFLIIEGIDQFGKGILGRMDLVDNKQKVGSALIVEKCLHGIPPNDLKTVFREDIVNRDEVYSKSWSVARSKILLLTEDVEKDKDKEIKYAFLGKSSVFVKSSCIESHNCFTWAREKLFNLDEEKIQRDLQGKWTDAIVTKPSYYLPNKKETEEKSS